MKKISMRITTMILAVLMLVSVFSSCGKDGGSNNITRGPNEIEKPTHTQGEATEEPTSSTDDTTEFVDTTAEEFTDGTSDSGSGSTKKPTTTKATTAPPTTQPSQDQMLSIIEKAGFKYDERQGIFYSTLNCLQREAGFAPIYDPLAALGNMRYQTAKIDFEYDSMKWRIQLWKGQYGILGGAEIGVYTLPVSDPRVEFYDCADDNHLIEMEYKAYYSSEDYKNGKLYFEREWQKHWWLTGFKFGAVIPQNLVLQGRLRMYDNKMADAFEQGINKVGFRAGDASAKYDTYRRVGNDFYFLWRSVGNLNYK